MYEGVLENMPVVARQERLRRFSAELAHVVGDGPVPMTTAIVAVAAEHRIAASQVAQGLNYAHARGQLIIHPDDTLTAPRSRAHGDSFSRQTLTADFRAELIAQGLPADATLADLIRHHRGNAALAAAFDTLAAEAAVADRDRRDLARHRSELGLSSSARVDEVLARYRDTATHG
jgi:hypothetical protein